MGGQEQSSCLSGGGGVYEDRPIEEEKHLVQMYLTDPQYSLLADLIQKEIKRIGKEAGKDNSTKRQYMLDDQKGDWEKIERALADNVW